MTLITSAAILMYTPGRGGTGSFFFLLECYFYREPIDNNSAAVRSIVLWELISVDAERQQLLGDKSH